MEGQLSRFETFKIKTDRIQTQKMKGVYLKINYSHSFREQKDYLDSVVQFLKSKFICQSVTLLPFFETFEVLHNYNKRNKIQKFYYL